MDDDEFLNKIEELIGKLTVTINGVSLIVADVKNIQIGPFRPEHDSCENFYYYTHPSGKCVPNCIFFRPPIKKELKKPQQGCPYPAKRCKFKSFVERNSKFFVMNKGVKHGN